MKRQTLKPILILCTTFFCATSVLFGQSANSNFKSSVDQAHYRTAVGVRAGGTSGLTIKHFTGDYSAIEGILGIHPNAFSITALYEKYAGGNTPGLHWYYGGGGHVAFESGRIYSYRDGHRWRNYYNDGEVGIGVDGILGLEYKIPPIPFAVSLDVKPFLEVNTKGGAYVFLDPGLGIKITF